MRFKRVGMARHYRRANLIACTQCKRQIARTHIAKRWLEGKNGTRMELAGQAVPDLSPLISM